MIQTSQMQKIKIKNAYKKSVVGDTAGQTETVLCGIEEYCGIITGARL